MVFGFWKANLFSLNSWQWYAFFLTERVEFLTKFQKQKQVFQDYFFSFQNLAWFLKTMQSSPQSKKFSSGRGIYWLHFKKLNSKNQMVTKWGCNFFLPILLSIVSLSPSFIDSLASFAGMANFLLLLLLIYSRWLQLKVLLKCRVI